MALITTIGAANADSYATLAEYQAYLAKFGRSASGADATDKQNLRRAAWIMEGYDFVGVRQYEVQALAWPRTYTGIVLDFAIDSDTIPAKIKEGQMELAYIIQAGTDPVASVTAPIEAEEKQVGSLRTVTRYAGSKTTPRFVAVERILRPYLRAGAGQVSMVRA